MTDILRKWCMALLPLAVATVMLTGCERQPILHLDYYGDIDTKLPLVELRLDVFWDYEMEGKYNWRDEWY